MPDSEADDILIDRSRAGIALLTLNRPARLNALSQPTVRRLCAALDALAQDDNVRVLVLTGAGRGFCAGWDLTTPLTRRDDQPLDGEPSVADLMAGQELFAGMVRRLRALDKVVIAAVNGVAVGAGFALTLGADIRVAARSASFHVGAVRIGLTAGECGISYHLPRLVGASRAFELMLTGRPCRPTRPSASAWSPRWWTTTRCCRARSPWPPTCCATALTLRATPGSSCGPTSKHRALTPHSRWKTAPRCWR